MCFVKQEESLIYLDGEPIFPNQEALIPLSFFQALKCKDFEYAKILLDDTLKQNTSSRSLEGYFGDFDKVTPYNYSKEKGFFIALSKNNVNTIYRITIKDKKICEIHKLLRNNGVDSYE